VEQAAEREGGDEESGSESEESEEDPFEAHEVVENEAEGDAGWNEDGDGWVNLVKDDDEEEGNEGKAAAAPERAPAPVPTSTPTRPKAPPAKKSGDSYYDVIDLLDDYDESESEPESDDDGGDDDDPKMQAIRRGNVRWDARQGCVVLATAGARREQKINHPQTNNIEDHVEDVRVLEEAGGGSDEDDEVDAYDSALSGGTSDDDDDPYGGLHAQVAAFARAAGKAGLNHLSPSISSRAIFHTVIPLNDCCVNVI
jgi:hypothetical protein